MTVKRECPEPCREVDHGLYWLRHDLDENDARILRFIRDGLVPPARHRFAVAYLIALDCVDYVEDVNAPTGAMVITPKGLCALDWMTL